MPKRTPSKAPGKKTRSAQGNLLTTVIQREEEGYSSFCPELEIASQGETVEQATSNLREAVELFLETASPAEIKDRLRSEVYITNLQVALG